MGENGKIVVFIHLPGGQRLRDPQRKCGNAGNGISCEDVENSHICRVKRPVRQFGLEFMLIYANLVKFD